MIKTPPESSNINNVITFGINTSQEQGSIDNNSSSATNETASSGNGNNNVVAETVSDDLQFVNPLPISLVDNTHETIPRKDDSCVWAKDVHVDNYTIIEGNTGRSAKLGAYVVWTIQIQILTPEDEEDEEQEEEQNDLCNLTEDDACNGRWSLHAPRHEGHKHKYQGTNVITIHKRYSEFVSLRQRLWYAFPQQRKGIPELPPKSVVSKFRESFLESRRKGLEYFLLTILLNPVFAQSPIVKDFVRKK